MLPKPTHIVTVSVTSHHALFWRKTSQLARLLVEPGIPEVERIFPARKRPLEFRFRFGGDTPSLDAFIEGDDAGCFSRFVGQVRDLRGH